MHGYCLKAVLTILFACLATAGFAQTGESTVRFVNPAALASPNGYSHTVQVDLGTATMVIMSGQVALDKQGNVVGKGDFAKQVEQTFSNIKSMVEEAGGTMNDVVKITNYLTDMSQVQAFREVRDRFVNTSTPPASTTVQVSQLFRKEFLVEIEATAIIPKK